MNTDMKKQTALQWLFEQLPKLEAQIPRRILIQAKWQEEKTIDEAFADGQKNGYQYGIKKDVLHNAFEYYKHNYKQEE
jgi:hypothetical protein